MLRSITFLNIILLISSVGNAGFRKQPYLIYTGDNTQMKVAYQLHESESCSIQWGIDSSSLSDSMATIEYGNDHQHAPVLTGLNPGTRYYYEVVIDDTLHTGSFFSAPDTNETTIDFFAYGDTRSYPNDHNTIAGLIVDEYSTDSSLQSLILSVGDLVALGDNESDWDDDFFNPDYPNIITMLANLPYQACMGNHEQSGVLFKKYFPYPFVNQRYWSFDYGPAHFVIIDQYTSYSSGSAQLTWIANDLSSSSKPWKFMILHAPGWSAGGHSNNISVQEYLQPLCEQHNVQIVFGGHNHYYARAEVNNVIHITTGGGGAPIYSPSPSYPFIVATAAINHYCKIDIDNNLLNFNVIDRNGNIIDDFHINSFGIKPLNVTLSSSFMQLGGDSLLLLTEVINPVEHSLHVHAHINDWGSTYADSIELLDDGAHFDGEAGDGVWGNYLGPVSFEDGYSVDIAITDLDADMYFISPNMVQFTTIGPLVVEDYYFYGSDTIPNHGDATLKMKIILGNQGNTTPATNITASLTAIDTVAFVRAESDPAYGDISVGQTDTTSGFYRIRFHDIEPDTAYAYFKLDIASEGHLFWTDTFSVFVRREGVGIHSESRIPREYSLYQNYPNPFNPITTIRYELPKRSEVQIMIYDLLGRRVTTLVSENQDAGYKSIQWDASNVSSGMYFYQIRAGEFVQTRKMVLLK